MAAVRGATAKMASHEARLLQALRSQEGFEQKSPVYVRELYPYRLQPRPSSSSQLTMCAMRAIPHYFWDGGSSTCIFMHGGSNTWGSFTFPNLLRGLWLCNADAVKTFGISFVLGQSMAGN